MTFFRSTSPLLLAATTMVGLLSPMLAQAEDKKPVKVFILAGQSNMQGHGRIALGKDGDLDYAAQQEQFAYLKKDGKWVERDDVWYFHKSGRGEIFKGNLKPGQGANESSVGPELAFGHVVGNYYDEQVLLIKCAWGGQAIAMTFRPPIASVAKFSIPSSGKWIGASVSTSTLPERSDSFDLNLSSATFQC